MDKDETKPETTFRFITGLGPTGPDDAIEYVLGYRIESVPAEGERPEIIYTSIEYEHLSRLQLEQLRDQINGAIGFETGGIIESIKVKAGDVITLEHPNGDRLSKRAVTKENGPGGTSWLNVTDVGDVLPDGYARKFSRPLERLLSAGWFITSVEDGA